jgi:hypothetical protein
MAAKKFRVATEGATTDGRRIERVWLEQIARNYDPKIYGARVNMEHIKGFAPDSVFKRYGDVLSVSTEEIDGKLALFAVIDPTEELVALSKRRQKVYTSIEIAPEFADSGEAYLVGLAITDDPASLGTEMLSFCAQASSNPLGHRKQHSNNLFTEALPFSLELEEAATIDGCRKHETFFRIIFPILKPIHATVLVLNGIWIWNDYLLPLLVLGKGNDIQTIPVAVSNFAGTFVKQWDLILTAILLAMIPVVVFFLFAQRFIVRGMVAGSIK